MEARAYAFVSCENRNGRNKRRGGKRAKSNNEKRGSAPLPLNQSGSSIAQFLQQGVQAIGAVLQIRNQQQLAEENLRRVRQGLQPIDIGDVPGLVPTAEARVGIDESTQRTLLLVAALGIGAYLFTQSQKR